jgi:amidase
MHEYVARDATGLAELIESGEISAEEVQAVAREAIGKVNPELNAVADGPWDQPLDYNPDGPFHGVPFVFKDLFVHAAGVPTRAGSRLLGDGVTFPYDTHLMTRFKEAGLAALAVTTTPEFGLNANTEALVYGSTRNPWDTALSPGGSSGGSAALVSAGAVPVGHANDGGGSVRIPAAFTGLVGLKPSRNRTPAGPNSQELVYGNCVEFAVTRSVRDAALLLDAIAGPMPGDKYILREPPRPWRDEVGAAPGRLRIALHTTSWAGSPVDAEVAAAAEAVGRRLEGLGHDVMEGTPTFDWDRLREAITTSWCAIVAEAVTVVATATGAQPGPDTLEATSLSFYERGMAMSVVEFAGAAAVFNEVSRQVGEFFTQFDLLLTPTANVPPQPLGFLNANDASYDATSWIQKLFDIFSFTPLFNFTGLPAISLPLGTTASGLPIGVQLAAPMCDETTLIRIASQLEAAMPWDQRPRPAVHAGH